MFTELMELMKNRAIVITASALDEIRIRVNFIPQKNEDDDKVNREIQSGHEKEVAKLPQTALDALTTPLCLTGTPAEIDAGLISALTKFTSQHVTLQHSVDEATTEIRTAISQIKERDKQKSSSKSKNGAGKREATLPLAWTTGSENAQGTLNTSEEEGD